MEASMNMLGSDTVLYMVGKVLLWKQEAGSLLCTVYDMCAWKQSVVHQNNVFFGGFLTAKCALSIFVVKAAY